MKSKFQTTIRITIMVAALALSLTACHAPAPQKNPQGADTQYATPTPHEAGTPSASPRAAGTPSTTPRNKQ